MTSGLVKCGRISSQVCSLIFGSKHKTDKNTNDYLVKSFGSMCTINLTVVRSKLRCLSP